MQPRQAVTALPTDNPEVMKPLQTLVALLPLVAQLTFKRSDDIRA